MLDSGELSSSSISLNIYMLGSFEDYLLKNVSIASLIVYISASLTYNNCIYPLGLIIT